MTEPSPSESPADGQADDDPQKVVLDVEVAEEVVALVKDEPGDADEELLDQAIESLEDAGPRVPADGQKMAAEGEAIAIELTPTGADALRTLIEDDREVQPARLRRIGQRIGSKLRKARAKRRSGKR